MASDDGKYLKIRREEQGGELVLTLGQIVHERREQLKVGRPAVNEAANLGNRFLVELEKGKRTVQIDKTLDALESLGGTLYVRWDKPPQV
jgi:hypothetical protein